MKIHLTMEDAKGNGKYIQWLRDKERATGTDEKIIKQMDIGNLLEVLTDCGVVYSIDGKVFNTGMWKVVFIGNEEYQCIQDELIDSLWEAFRLMVDETLVMEEEHRQAGE